MPEFARDLSVETGIGVARITGSVSAHDLTDEQISFKAFEFEPNLPEGYDVRKCSAILLVVEGLIALDEVKMDLSIETKALASPCSGQGLDALEWGENGCSVTVGTEDEECLSHRFPGLKLKNKLAIEYGEQSMKLRLSNLGRCRSPSFHFILAENDDPETVEASSWYAVDQPHSLLLEQQ
ncbi:hypothetical protein [Cohaesibacter gelatinilyticus]|uniref:Uncharacterized protein n=1 Tax=Cohaesibacter gelatinilyticus TaxID=372072 RepID=A0A285PHJ0_9HYPH|nr:hypothetical protein [Cohaesibacter gelatinilyticus]SNZ21200.1 hypothetical protein SAMN06265368_4317 [Cohaesibacter gelatinilyticus]HAT85984.1 hypothetical protein [Hyphomicrobiales bacterium]